MEDGKIVELYWQRSQDAIAATQCKYGRLCHRIARNILQQRPGSRRMCQRRAHAGVERDPAPKAAKAGSLYQRSHPQSGAGQIPGRRPGRNGAAVRLHVRCPSWTNVSRRRKMSNRLWMKRCCPKASAGFCGLCRSRSGTCSSAVTGTCIPSKRSRDSTA